MNKNSNVNTGAEIVPLWTRQAKMDKSPLNDMRQYWTELCAGRQVPLRSEVDPRAISSSLEYGFILERQQPGSVRFRLAGTHLSDLMGMEVRGMPIRAFIDPAGRAQFSATLEQVFTGPEIHEYRLVSDSIHAPKLTARLLLLPLKSDEGLIDRALGCLVSEGTIGMPPRRFKVNETRVTSLTDGQMKRRFAPEALAGFSEPKAPYNPPVEFKRPDGRPNLRLVKSDD